MVDIIDDIVGQLGANRSQVTSTYRSQDQQNALIARGATSTQHSAHTDGNAFDYVPNKGQSPGDVSTALAAYGFPDVKVLDETSPGQGTGPHYHVSAKSFAGAFLPGATGNSPPIPTTNQAAASTGSTAPANDPLNPFAVSPEVKADVQQSSDAIDNLANVVKNSDATLTQNQADHAAAMKASVDQRNAIVKGNDDATAELQQTVTPIFARRASLAARQVEIQDMNPIKRAVLGLFNRNYDPGHIKAVDDALANQAQEAGQQYQAVTTANNQLIHDIETRQAGNDSIASLIESSANLDKSVASDTVQVAQQRLSNAIMGIHAGSEITAAQAQARISTLSQMTPQQINRGLAEAKANGGTAMVNGVPLSTEEMTERSQTLQEQGIHLKTMQLGLQAAEQGVADSAEQRLISHMSSADLQTAINNDGMFHGQRLNQNLLTQAFSVSQSRVAGLAQQSMTNIDPQTYTAGVDRLNQQTQDTMRRITGVTGAMLPTEYKSYVNGMVAKSQMWQQKINSAPASAQPMLRAQALQDLGSLSSGVGGVIDKIVGGMTRNKDEQLVYKGWMTGQPVTGEAMTRGLIGMFQGGNGLPKGVQLSGPAAKMFQAAQAAYNGVVAKYGGQQSIQEIMAGGGKVSKDQFNRELMTAVTNAGGGAWNNALAANIVPQTVAMAQAAGHPAGQIRPVDLSAATQHGDQVAIHTMAQNLGWTDQQAMQVFGPGGSKAVGYATLQAKGGKAKDVDYNTASQQYATTANIAMQRALDASPSAHPGFVPSHAYINFINSPQYSSMLTRYGSALPTQSFGNFIGDGISNGSIPQLMDQHARAHYQAAGAIASSDQQAVRDSVSLYQNDPMKRLAVLAAGVPGLSQHDQTVLVNGIKNSLESSGVGTQSQFGEPQNINDIIDSTVMHGKFQDPHLERVRRQAAQNWKQHTQAGDSMIARLFKGALATLDPSN